MTTALGLAALREAAARIAGYVRATPLIDAPAFSKATGARVYLKLENRQLTGSFKDRGAFNAALQLDPAQRARGVITMSAGNHAQSVAYVGQELGIPATIVMPATTPFLKVRRTQQLGAQVVLHGQTLADASERARALEAERGLTFIHPYDDPAVIAGQGTLGLEIMEALPEVETIVVPVGGGGLLAGVLIAAKELAPPAEVIGVETQAYPSLVRLLAGEPPAATSHSTVAEGIAVKTIGELPLRIIVPLVDGVLTCGETAIEHAIHAYLEEEKLVVEGAGAASLALLLQEAQRFAGKTVVLIVSGGNIDTGLLASVINRVRLREDRVHTIRVEIPDQPGLLAQVAAIVSSLGANILEVEHQRQFSEISAKSAYLALSFETHQPADAREVVTRLQQAGFPTTILT